MKVSINNELCQGHARCWHIAPDFFTLDEEGYSNIGQDKVVPEGSEALVLQAVAACPEKAFTVDETSG